MKKLYSEIEKLRKNVSQKKYRELKEKNEGDKIYGWVFEDDDVLYEELEYLQATYSEYYIKKVLNVYLEVLQSMQRKVK